MPKLVITEKPSVAQDIAAVLHATERGDGFLSGNNWIVSWCVGHLVELAPSDAYGEQYAKWRLEDLPIIPTVWKHNVSSGKKKQFDVLRRLLTDKNVDSVICATDAGREGELIFRLVYEQAGCKKDGGRLPPIQRLWISSMEESAIEEGFRNLRPGAEYDRLYQAALCRSQADWLIGINATRLFSVIYGTTLNIGRVQTPTLAMLVKREADIAAFVSEPFYTPTLDCGEFTASGEKQGDRQKAEAVRSACSDKNAVVATVERQEKTTAPPRLYDLTTLQREANRLFGFTAQQTLDYTQSLYEKKLCTYPRTDSQFLTEDMRKTAGSLVTLMLLHLPFAQGIAFTPDIDHITDSSMVSDHHGIIPTAELAKYDLAALPAGERDVLHLIAVRLLCATAPTHRFEVVTAAITCEGHSFTARGRTVLQSGWTSVTLVPISATGGDRQKQATPPKALPELSEGQVFPRVTASVREGKTKPPRTFTEDLLLSAMESASAQDMPEDSEREGQSYTRHGLGTPATRAGIIEKLVKTGLLDRKARQLLPSQKAVNLIAVLPDAVKSPQLTAN